MTARVHCTGTITGRELAREEGAASALRRSPSTQAHERQSGRDPRRARRGALSGVRGRSRSRPRRPGACTTKRPKRRPGRAVPGSIGSGVVPGPIASPLRAPQRKHLPRAAQRRARRPRRPRQDHAGRRPPACHRHLRRPPGRRRPGHGLQRPGARAGHHHPRQGRVGRVEGRQDQPGRHPRPRRLRRRGRAGPDHGRRRAAARRRRRGPAAPDPLRALQGAGRRPAGRGRASTRSTARTPAPDEVLDEIYQLFLDLDADEHSHRVPGRLGHRP